LPTSCAVGTVGFVIVAANASVSKVWRSVTAIRRSVSVNATGPADMTNKSSCVCDNFLMADPSGILDPGRIGHELIDQAA